MYGFDNFEGAKFRHVPEVLMARANQGQKLLGSPSPQPPNSLQKSGLANRSYTTKMVQAQRSKGWVTGTSTGKQLVEGVLGISISCRISCAQTLCKKSSKELRKCEAVSGSNFGAIPRILTPGLRQDQRQSFGKVSLSRKVAGVPIKSMPKLSEVYCVSSTR